MLGVVEDAGLHLDAAVQHDGAQSPVHAPAVGVSHVAARTGSRRDVLVEGGGELVHGGTGGAVRLHQSERHDVDAQDLLTDRLVVELHAVARVAANALKERNGDALARRQRQPVERKHFVPVQAVDRSEEGEGDAVDAAGGDEERVDARLVQILGTPLDERFVLDHRVSVQGVVVREREGERVSLARNGRGADVGDRVRGVGEL